MTDNEYLDLVKEEALKIDPETAEAHTSYGFAFDPYGLRSDHEYWEYGKMHYARRPGSDIWVEFGDLPEETREALWKRELSAGPYPRC
jgi:hypothetical protein